MTALKDLTGMKFHYWTAIKHVPSPKGAKWECQCICGNKNTIEGKSLRNGRSKSCGCHKKEMLASAMKVRARTHGKSQSRTYGIWNAMMQRCNNPNSASYKNYGLKGVTVTPAWKTFSGFLSDMGECPINHSIERIDNDKGYSPENCIWINKAMQNRNKSNNIIITANNKAMLMADWSRETGIKIGTLWWRYKAGWSHSEIVNTPTFGVKP